MGLFSAEERARHHVLAIRSATSGTSPEPGTLLGRLVDCGRVVLTGTLTQMVTDRSTLTGQYLARYIEQVNEHALT
ncbi:hypothetical protein BKH24_06060 [Actinomyces oris]|nr:hypothetical protein BKH24_06060 [Actinomyces oris]